MTRLNHRKSGYMGQDAPRIAREVDLHADAMLGTWDFKWPAGTQIRVAFQYPNWLDPTSDTDRGTFVKVVQAIRNAAEQWSGANIGFDWLGHAPDRMPDLVFAPTSDARRDQSYAVLDGTASRYGESNYDVLVSLDRFARGTPTADTRLRLLLPSAELGTYNRRADYGVPTAYLGPLAAWDAGPPAEYYAPDVASSQLQKLARFYVLHEFGHILGLIHAHQDPARRDRHDTDLRIPPSGTRAGDVRGRLVALLNTRLGLDERYIEAESASLANNEVIAEWPGNERDSDWSATRGSSVMTVPYLHCLFAAGSAPPPECPHCDADLEECQNPTPGDLALLRALYP